MASERAAGRQRGDPRWLEEGQTIVRLPGDRGRSWRRDQSSPRMEPPRPGGLLDSDDDAEARSLLAHAVDSGERFLCLVCADVRLVCAEGVDAFPEFGIRQLGFDEQRR